MEELLTQTESTFVEFPSHDEILARLRAIDIYEPLFDPLFELMAERLSSKAYDRSAFVFILIELIYEFEEPTDRYFNELLSAAVFALTNDEELVKASLDAFQEIKIAIEPEAPEKNVIDEMAERDPAETAELMPFTEEELDELEEEDPAKTRVTEARTEPGLMQELQTVQKQIQDIGLSSRVLIQMALARPDSGNVSRAWREMAMLRERLREFDELLTKSQDAMLEAAGLLEKDND